MNGSFPRSCDILARQLLKTLHFIQRNRTTRKTFFKIMSAVIKHLGRGARGDAQSITNPLIFRIAPFTEPVVRLVLLEPEPALFIADAEKLATLFTILQTLATTG